MDKPTLIAAGRAQVRRQAEAIAALADQIDDVFAEVASAVLAVQGKIVAIGSGTSGIMAERFAHLLSVCGTPAFSLPTLDALHGGAGAVTPEDLVVAFSKGGRSSELTDLVRLLHGRGVRVIAVTEAPDSPFAAAADTVVTVQTRPSNADLDGLVATGSTLVAAAWGDALTAVLKDARGHSAADVVAVHPAGIVGHSGTTAAPPTQASS
ncbi:SIS domain-containing protein [Kineococcus sp. NBC_00420]|uniref:SIS domain-containing protein n=1 Tax=Kineococcus sp. NBC_00420 TaxID=2903564 RepID=UPI002E1FCA79